MLIQICKTLPPSLSLSSSHILCEQKKKKKKSVVHNLCIVCLQCNCKVWKVRRIDINLSKYRFEAVAFSARTEKCILASRAARSTIAPFSSSSWFESYPGRSQLLSEDDRVFGLMQKKKKVKGNLVFSTGAKTARQGYVLRKSRPKTILKLKVRKHGAREVNGNNL